MPNFFFFGLNFLSRKFETPVVFWWLAGQRRGRGRADVVATAAAAAEAAAVVTINRE